MSSKNELFESSSSEADTDDLIAAAKSQPIAKKKNGAAKTATKSAKSMQQPDADNDSDQEEEEEEEGGLFDSSSDEEDETPKKKKKKSIAKKKKLSSAAAAAAASSNKNNNKKKKIGRKERMEELAKKKRAAANAASGGGGGEPRRKRSKTGKKDNTTDQEDKGYDSGDSYNSTTFARTKEDDDFIDADDEDPDALKELYAEQHFDDERPEGYDSEEEKKRAAAAKAKGKKRTSTGGGGVDKISLSDDEDGPSASAALKDAVRRMQKKKREVKKLPQLEQEASEFLRLMDGAADADDESIAAKRPALKKLGMLSQVMDMLAQKDMQRVLLDLDLLMVCKRWVQPLPPDGKTLGNVTVRRRILEALSQMTGGENGINSGDLKRSGFGKVVMALFKHKKETPEMKKMLKAMIEQWSRPIFQKSGNLRDLERAQRVRGMNEMGSLVGIARQQQQQQQQQVAFGKSRKVKVAGGGGRAKDEDDLAQIIDTGSKNTNDIGNNRVRVPYSKGFQFSVRPADRTGDVSDKRNLVSAKAARSSMGRPEGDSKDSLQKRMLSKARPVNKQSQRSANISIEGRVVK